MKNRGSSKGNQSKWLDGEYWYKIDYLGYEGLSEYVVSHLLDKTNVKNYVKYELDITEKNKMPLLGCKSKNFLSDNQNILTLTKLFRVYKNIDIFDECERIDWTESDCISFVADTVKDITGLDEFGEYLTLLLEMDYFFYNDDRHFNNIAVIYNRDTDGFSYCPIFDNGAALFSDIKMSYPLTMSIDECIDVVKAKPFSPCFEDQVSAAREVYGRQFSHQITEHDLEEVIKNVRKYGLYSKEIVDRVEAVIKKRLSSTFNIFWG